MKTGIIPASLTAACILSLAALLVWAGSFGAPADRVGGPFRLTDDRGNVVTERAFPGQYLVVYFGYTNCRDVCPATLNTLEAALDRLGSKASRIQPLFITIDPLRDTQAVLHRYVSGFSPRLVGLGGTPAAVAAAAAAYHVISTPHGATWDHSAVMYLMAPDGRFLAPVPADASEMVVAQALARYVD